jgi:hypothetical protein
MARWMMTVGLLAMLTVPTGCGGGGANAPAPRVTVAGTVQLDGKPLDEGEIQFISKIPATLPIKNGKFEGQAEVGEARVEIRKYKVGEPIMMDGKPFGDPVKENILPAKYNSETTLKATIPASGVKDLKFDMESM